MCIYAIERSTVIGSNPGAFNCRYPLRWEEEEG
jgi:hypothetical protein